MDQSDSQEQTIVKANPWEHWLTIWTKPRETMRKIINGPDNRTELISLLLIGELINTLDRASKNNLGDTLGFSSLILTCIAIAFIAAPIYYFVMSWLLFRIGKFFGGQGSLREIRLAFIYSYIPTVCSSIIWIFMLLGFGHENFTELTPRMDDHVGTIIALGLLQLVISIWGIIINLSCLAEAHRFSALKALMTYIFPVLLLLLLMLVAFTPFF